MSIVIDSNILFSALLKDSITRRIILNYNGMFLLPSFVLEEAGKYKELLLNKSGMHKEEFEDLLLNILQKVKIIRTEELKQYRSSAQRIINDIDPDDELIVACAIAHRDNIIWSDDKNLKKQNNVKILNTSEVIDFLY